METIITIKKNKPAFKALILLAKELEKNDRNAISIKKRVKQKRVFELIAPLYENLDQPTHYNQLFDFPELDELRKIAWPKIS
jgi:hypothetical protein